MEPSLTTVGTHVPYGITYCYLPPSRGDKKTLSSLIPPSFAYSPHTVCKHANIQLLCGQTPWQAASGL